MKAISALFRGAIACFGIFLLSTIGAAAASELEQSLLDVFKRYKCDVAVEQRVKDPQTGKLLYPAHRDFSYVSI